MKAIKSQKWLESIWKIINPFSDPSLTVAVVLTFVEEIGQHDNWYWIIVIGALNWLAVRGILWLVVNFTFATTFISRRLWWSIKHPRLAWRILDAVGHEEIVIGGLPNVTEMMNPLLGASGIQVIGELPAGTEIPMLGMANGQMAPDFASLANTGIFPATVTGSLQNPGMGNVYGNGFISGQQTDGLPQSFPQRSSREEEQLRQQLAAYARLLDDWILFTEEKWRTVSDSQLGWKPLRGRWGSWDDIFQDAYAAKTSDPMAKAAQVAGEATARRFDTSKEKGSAASAVACFMRDMVTLRRGMEMLQGTTETPTPAMQQPSTMQFPHASGPLRGGLNGAGPGTSPRSSLIRRPSPIFVDADTEK